MAATDTKATDTKDTDIKDTDTKDMGTPDGGSSESSPSEVRVAAWVAVTEGIHRVRESLPSSRQCAFFGGLGALAALSVIEWPVAAAIALGTVVAQRGDRRPRSESARA